LNYTNIVRKERLKQKLQEK